jgi:hypothetical protein
MRSINKILNELADKSPHPIPPPLRGEGREGVISFGCGSAALWSLWLDFGRRTMVRERKGEEGFALIAALMIFWVLIALGMLVFSVTTQDVRVSSRTVGERKAFMAAESGIHQLTQNFVPAYPSSSVANDVKVDATSSGDPNTTYTIGPYVDKDGNQTWNPTSGPGGVPIPGYEPNWGRRRYLARVTGKNTAYNSSVQIDTGIGYGPVDITTLYK